MSRSLWAMRKWNGASFVADGSIYRPNSNTAIGFVSTQSSVSLANGERAFFTPEVVYNKEDITMEFLEIYPEDSFYTKIINYIQNQDYVEITTHLGETFTGKFLSIRRVWLISVTDTFDFQVTFARMD